MQGLPARLVRRGDSNPCLTSSQSDALTTEPTGPAKEDVIEMVDSMIFDIGGVMEEGLFAPKTTLDRIRIHNLEGVKNYKIQSKSFHKRRGLSYIIQNIIVSDWMQSRNELPRKPKVISRLFHKNPSLVPT